MIVRAALVSNKFKFTIECDHLRLGRGIDQRLRGSRAAASGDSERLTVALLRIQMVSALDASARYRLARKYYYSTSLRVVTKKTTRLLLLR
jgi:hypothetical protein